MEAFRRVTNRGESRLCCRFPAKPSADLLAIIKRNGGRYRKAGHGEASCWFIPAPHGPSLVAELGDHPLAAMLLPLLQDTERPPPVPEEAEEAAAAAEPAGIAETEEQPVNRRAPKRQRRSGRIPPPPTCFACLFEVRELKRCGRFVEAPVPHECGF